MRTCSHTRPPLLLLLLVPLALLFAGCGSDDGDESSGVGTTDDGAGATEPATVPSADDDPLLDRTFVATSITEDGEDHALVDGTELRITVAEDSFSVNAGCNTLVGGYTLTDGAIQVGEMGATMMACDGALSAQDEWLTEVLARPGEVTTEGEQVILTFGDTVLVMDETEGADLVGTTWSVDSLIEGTDSDGTASSVDPAIGASLVLSADGTYAVATGCNTGGGDYQLDEAANTLTFELPRLTRMACTDESAQAVETALVALLDGEAGYEITEQRLTLSEAGSGVGFRAG